MFPVPRLVTPPVDPVANVSEIKQANVIDVEDYDLVLERMAAAATAFLDGYRGVLGRAIMHQTWVEEFVGSGPHFLALPDITALRLTADDVPVSDVEVIGQTARGYAFCLPSGTGKTVAEYDCALPAAQRALAKDLVCMMVGQRDLFREGLAVGKPVSEMPIGIQHYIGILRWVRL